jgi:hypothetical protein
MEEMYVRSLRVRSTHAWKRKRSRRPEISSSGQEEHWVGTISSGVVGLAATVLTLAAAFFFDIPAADLGAAVDLESGFLDLAVFLVAATLGCWGPFVTC